MTDEWRRRLPRNSGARASKRATHDRLCELLDARRIELGLTMLELDCDADLQSGYFAKLMSAERNLGDFSLPRILTALGVDITLIPKSSSRQAGGADRAA